VTLLALVAGGLIVSGAHPYDRMTWLLEVFPILLAAPLLVATYGRFRLTNLLYVLVALHAAILMAGGHYTYARVPLGDWMKHAFGLARNDYDRIGHFAQGFVPAIAAREVLLRLGVLRRKGWLFFLVLAICLTISVFYEFIEWWTALASGSAADDFLATQGDPWDTQWDMFTAGVGCLAAQLLLARPHARAIAALDRAPAPEREETGP